MEFLFFSEIFTNNFRANPVKLFMNVFKLVLVFHKNGKLIPSDPPHDVVVTEL